jgi:hypothetical protein
MSRIVFAVLGIDVPVFRRMAGAASPFPAQFCGFTAARSDKLGAPSSLSEERSFLAYLLNGRL